VVAALFPIGEGNIPERADPLSGWTEELSVIGGKMGKAFVRLRGRSWAPEPDGVHGRV